MNNKIKPVHKPLNESVKTGSLKRVFNRDDDEEDTSMGMNFVLCRCWFCAIWPLAVGNFVRQYFSKKTFVSRPCMFLFYWFCCFFFLFHDPASQHSRKSCIKAEKCSTYMKNFWKIVILMNYSVSRIVGSAAWWATNFYTSIRSERQQDWICIWCFYLMLFQCNFLVSFN